MTCRGFYVETYGGGQWGVVAWYATRAEADAEVARRKMLGEWAGMPPRVTPACTCAQCCASEEVKS